MAYFLIIAAVLIRVLSHFDYIPHIPNFAPIAAMALLGGVYFNKKYALILPLVAMFIADYFIGFYNPVLMICVYGSFIIIGAIGLYIKKNKSLQNIVGATLCGSVLFFLITNFAMWAVQPYMKESIYPHTLQGLLQCYTMGLPSFRNTLMGDIFYVGAMFGLMELAIYVKARILASKKVSSLV